MASDISDLLQDPSAALLDGRAHAGCAGRFRLATHRIAVKVGRLSTTVESAAFVCDACGEVRQAALQREQARLRAMRALRAEHGLLTPQEIRRARTALALEPRQLDKLIGLSEGFVRGYENETYLQSSEADALLRRALTDAEARQQMAAAAGITLPDPEALRNDKKPTPGTSSPPPDPAPTS